MKTKYTTKTGANVVVCNSESNVFSVDIKTKSGIAINLNSVTVDNELFCGYANVNGKTMKLKIETTESAREIFNLHRITLQNDIDNTQSEKINKEYKAHYNKVLETLNK